MKSRSPDFPPNVVHGATLALEQLALPLAGIRTALVVSQDGFEIASLPQHGMNSVKISAMTSSLMAMARAVGSEVSHQNCTRLVFEAEQGTVVVQPIEARFPSLLCFVLGPEAVLGAALWTMGRVSARLRTID